MCSDENMALLCKKTLQDIRKYAPGVMYLELE
jgi:hypothetical protein